MLFSTHKPIPQFRTSLQSINAHMHLPINLTFHLFRKSQHLKIVINSPSLHHTKKWLNTTSSLFHISIYSLILCIKSLPPLTIHIYSLLWAWYGTQRSCLNICCTRWTLFLSLYSILTFPFLLVIMKPLILVYCYCNKGHNVLDTIKVFPHVDLIIMKKMYNFYHVNTFISLLDVIAGGLLYLLMDHFFLLCTCYNGLTFLLTNYGGNA